MGMERAFEVRRWVAMGIAIAGAGVCLQWMIAQPAPAELHRDFLPLFVGLSQLALVKSPAGGLVGIWLIAIAALSASLLGLYLALKSRGLEPALRLSLSLATGGLAVAYLYLVLPYPIMGRPASAVSPLALFLGDGVAYSLWFVAMWELVRVWRIFPQSISRQDWERHIAAFLESERAKARRGWRRRVYPQKLLDPAFLERMSEKEGLARLVWYGNTAKQRARIHDLIESRAMMAGFVAAAAACAAVELALRASLPGLPSGQRASGLLAAMAIFMPTMYVWMCGIGGGVLSYSYLDYHRKWGSDEDRRRIAWILSTLFVAGVLFFAIFQAVFAGFILAVFFALERLGDNLASLLILPIVVGFPLFAIACIVSLALSVVYRGAIDPRHAARRITVWGLLGIVVAVLFVLLERVVAMKVVQWMSLPQEWGPLVAGALVAATVAPIRGTTEKAVNRLVTRFLPADYIASGQKRTSAIALCDLSGYTALSDIDQQKALLHAALLQQKAARIASTRNGRVVKSMGDAVLLEFAEASDACAALEDLHAQVPAAAIQIGLDPLPLHSGAHYGEIVVGPDGDVYGQTVNLAARLQGQAVDSQIVVSDAFAKAAGLAATRLVSLGARTLKNVQQPVECHLVVPVPSESEKNLSPA